MRKRKICPQTYTFQRSTTGIQMINFLKHSYFCLHLLSNSTYPIPAKWAWKLMELGPPLSPAVLFPACPQVPDSPRPPTTPSSLGPHPQQLLAVAGLPSASCPAA